MSASDDEEKCDRGREGDMVYKTGNTNGVWRRQSEIGILKGKGRKSRNRMCRCVNGVALVVCGLKWVFAQV